jgi:hypothetical protein
VPDGKNIASGVDVFGCVPGSFVFHKLIIARLYGSACGISPTGLSAFPSQLKPDVPCGGFYGSIRFFWGVKLEKKLE